MKHWKKSRTIIIGAVSAILPVIEFQFHILKPLLGESAYNIALMAISALAALFVYLRTITTGPVVRKKTLEKSVTS